MKITLLLSFTCLLSFSSFSQSLRFGIGYQEFPFEGKILKAYSPSNQAGELTYTEEVSDKVEAISFLAGAQMPLYNISDQIRVCLASDLIGIYWVQESPEGQNFQGQVSSSGSGSGIFGFQWPLYSTIEFGARDKKGRLTGLNAEVGGGIMYQGINNMLVVPFKGSHFTPFTKVGVGYGQWQFAFSYSFSSFKDAYPSNLGDIPRLEVKNYSFHLYRQLPL